MIMATLRVRVVLKEGGRHYYATTPRNAGLLVEKLEKIID
jgi:hypothetical protein